MSNATVVMNPCQYSHFLAKSETLLVKALELHEGMSKEGASESVLEAITAAHAALIPVRKAIVTAQNEREEQMKAQRAEAAKAREIAAEQRKAETQARRAAKAASKSSTVTPSQPESSETPAETQETATAS